MISSFIDNMSSLSTKQVVAAIAILEHQERFLILRRVDSNLELHGKWEFPGGGVELGEFPFETMKREIQEETGLSVQEATLLGVHTHVWESAEQPVQVFLVVYRAQVDLKEIRLSPEENDAYQWVTLDEFLALPDVIGTDHGMIQELYLPFIASRHKS